MSNNENPASWHVYLLRCADMSLYCGITTDVRRRLAAHNAGTASRCTRARLPVTLEAAVPVPDKSAALRLELRIKKAPADKKVEMLLSAGDGEGPQNTDLNALGKSHPQHLAKREF